MNQQSQTPEPERTERITADKWNDLLAQRDHLFASLRHIQRIWKTESEACADNSRVAELMACAARDATAYVDSLNVAKPQPPTPNARSITEPTEEDWHLVTSLLSAHGAFGRFVTSGDLDKLAKMVSAHVAARNARSLAAAMARVALLQESVDRAHAVLDECPWLTPRSISHGALDKRIEKVIWILADAKGASERLQKAEAALAEMTRLHNEARCDARDWAVKVNLANEELARLHSAHREEMEGERKDRLRLDWLSREIKDRYTFLRHSDYAAGIKIYTYFAVKDGTIPQHMTLREAVDAAMLAQSAPAAPQATQVSQPPSNDTKPPESIIHAAAPQAMEGGK